MLKKGWLNDHDQRNTTATLPHAVVYHDAPTSGRPPWRDPAQMWQFHQRSMQGVNTAISNPHDLVLIAEDVRGLRLGFLHVTQTTDFFIGELQGYISAVAVSEQAEGKALLGR